MLATQFNSIYWSTACLIVNSGSAELIGGSTNYEKIAKALGAIINNGIKVSLIDINKSDFSFKPDAENNQILYALKALINVGDDIIQNIINNRPYASMLDFMSRVNLNKRAMISLIKSGAFDQFLDRKEAMIQYLWLTCKKKKDLNLRNLPQLIRENYIPNDENLQFAKKIFEFNRFLKDKCGSTQKDVYNLNVRAIDFLGKIGHEKLIDFTEGYPTLNVKSWNKIYNNYMDTFRSWISDNKTKLLKTLNTQIFMEQWNKYALGSISAWEMNSLCFYYHEHELVHVNNSLYGFANFNKLSEIPQVERFFKKGSSNIPIYKLHKICGTCIAKNKNKSIVYLLTTSGVVPVKFRQEHFALFNKQTFQKNLDGTKTKIEGSWFNRGEMIVVQGIRRGDDFIVKKYANTGHQLYKIDQVNENGTLLLRSERKKGETDEEDPNE